jgi:purine-cytosine permease-like protein
VISEILQSSISGLTTGTSPGAWVAAVLVEHLFFRKRNFALYDVRSWDVPSQLPLGAAALGASVLGFGAAIPLMGQAWYTGPLGRKIGDAGFAAVLTVAGLSYIPLRRLEKRWRGV